MAEGFLFSVRAMMLRFIFLILPTIILASLELVSPSD